MLSEGSHQTNGPDAHGSAEGQKGGVELNAHALQHASALANLLGGDERLRVLTMVDEIRTLLDVDERDLLRVLVSLVQQAELSCCGTSQIELDVTACTTAEPTSTLSGVLPPDCYAHVRVGCSCDESTAPDATASGSVKRPTLSPVGALTAVLTILEGAGGGLCVVPGRGRCLSLEVLMPARIEARKGA